MAATREVKRLKYAAYCYFEQSNLQVTEAQKEFDISQERKRNRKRIIEWFFLYPREEKKAFGEYYSNRE